MNEHVSILNTINETDKFKKFEEEALTYQLKAPENTSTIPGITGKGDLSSKPHLVALNPALLYETGKAFRFGQMKHGVNNFRKMTPEASQELVDALLRHLYAYLQGDTHASDSEVHHLAHVNANLNMLFRLIDLHGDEEVLKYISGGDIDE